MIQKINHCKELLPYLRKQIEDEGIEVEIDNNVGAEEIFQNTITDFLSRRFKEIFLADQYKYKDIKLYLVSDAYGLSEKYNTYEEYKKIQNKIHGRDSLKVDRSLGSKLFRFKGRIVRTEFDIPLNPIIRKVS